MKLTEGRWKITIAPIIVDHTECIFKATLEDTHNDRSNSFTGRDRDGVAVAAVRKAEEIECLEVHMLNPIEIIEL